MRGQEIQERLHNGQCVYGTHICSLNNPVHMKLMTKMQLDFAFICAEHMPVDRSEISMMCQFYEAHGVAPIVRIPEPNAIYAAMAMDGGAQGIIVPYVETVEQVQAMVGAIKYRPLKGILLDQIFDHSTQLNEKTTACLKDFNRDNFLIIGIESVAAVENLEAMLAIEGVDGVFIGPHDLSISSQIPEEYDSPAFISLIEDIIRKCRKAGVGVGAHTYLTELNPEHLQRYFDAGMNLVINGADVRTLVTSMNRELAVLRAMNGDVYALETSSNDQPATCLK